MASVTLPPLSATPPSFSSSRENHPIPDDDVGDCMAIGVGVELLVSGLDHSSPTAAVSAFNKVVQDLQAAEPHIPFPPSIPNPRNYFNYVYVSLHRPLSNP